MADQSAGMPQEMLASFETKIPLYYANYINIVASFNDLRLVFGRQSPTGLPQFECQVYLSPITAKQLAELLSVNLSEYEKAVGPIPTQPKISP